MNDLQQNLFKEEPFLLTRTTENSSNNSKASLYKAYLALQDVRFYCRNLSNNESLISNIDHLISEVSFLRSQVDYKSYFGPKVL